MDCVYSFLNHSGFKEVGRVGNDRFQKRVSRLTPRAARPNPRGRDRRSAEYKGGLSIESDPIE
jgi:hypothetical protein